MLSRPLKIALKRGSVWLLGEERGNRKTQQQGTLRTVLLVQIRLQPEEQPKGWTRKQNARQVYTDTWRAFFGSVRKGRDSSSAMPAISSSVRP